MKIAIIGGGVSGLSLAYHLESQKIDFVLFEKEKQLGGNAHTRKTRHNGREKFVDLAVNDFNPLTYRRLVQLLEKTGSGTGRVNAQTTFFASDGFLSRESELKNGELGAEIRRFQYEACEVLRDRQYRRYSVKEYFEEKGYSDRFLQQYLYPRIQGLFFYPPGGVSALPVQFVMNFYALQGGYKQGSAPAAVRFNFKGGAGAWIANLARQIPARKISAGAIPQIRRSERGFRVANGRLDIQVDKVVFACHADDLCKDYAHLLSTRQQTVLSKVKYARMLSVAHCDASYLPLATEEVSAYNCHVKAPGDPGAEYTITYNCNEHQNQSGEGQNLADARDLFFVTVNPTRPIEERYLLRDEHGRPLVKEFSRNLCDFELLQAQQELPLLQGQNGLYFTGGYTNGIGLHENCLKQSEEIAEVLGRLAQQAAAVRSEFVVANHHSAA